MATTTPNFGWPVPTSTDLVKDGATAIEGLGDAIDASLLDLKGGTSGQILAKNSNTDMDFIWIANDQGDITGITATSPLTGGGTSGAVTVGIQSASTTQSGAVQLTDSTSSTSTTTAATPNAVKSAFDLATTANTKAQGDISASIVDAKGDLIAATAADTVSRLAVGANNTVLTADSSTATGLKWATPATGGGGLTLVKSQTIGSGVSSVTVTDAFSSTYDNYLINVTGGSGSTVGASGLLTLGSTSTGYYLSGIYMLYSSSTVNGYNVNNGSSFNATYVSPTGHSGSIILQNPFLSDETTFQSTLIGLGTSSEYQARYVGFLNNTTSYTAFTITAGSGTMTGGTIRVYGFQNS